VDIKKGYVLSMRRNISWIICAKQAICSNLLEEEIECERDGMSTGG